MYGVHYIERKVERGIREEGKRGGGNGMRGSCKGGKKGKSRAAT